MVEMMLLFQRATREGNWILHSLTVSIMMPWYFAYDSVNYARYLPVYWTEMVNLEERHPSIYQEFLKGHFMVQRQQKYGFDFTACDQVIVQTFNRESKIKDGQIGITLKRGAAHRWVLSQHERASISNQCEIMAGK
ncbi:hypothetical protein AVEN_106848-1 [Araneus ventricosus]|uniref:Uncharacterized protein n=1 Tax=Araneus ventricosus TaxID=182803 RepID=A0A4Y2SW76_ARAVE|nr:hypothetical protein AVEN_106848-1 [Araneus ventricosus]